MKDYNEMHRFASYDIREHVSETPYSAIYRANKPQSSHTVILKVLKTNDPAPSLIARFKHEFELIRNIKSKGVVRVLDIVEDQGCPALVMADFDAVSLKSHIKSEMSVELILDLAARIAEILGDIHQEGIIHRDIKPGNILYNQDKDILKLTDFGIAAEVTRKNDEVYNTEIIEGTLAYMSPEQTGRINCPVDYRTDLYSLGITIYEMLTGGVPFIDRDPLVVFHGHIAKTPIDPDIINPDIPEVVSKIVMKLLAKIPEDRYQSAFGLMADLRQSLEDLKTKGRIESFPLALHDISLKFNIPQVLVGREQSVAEIEATFQQVAEGGVGIFFVTGEPGIGKTSVVNEIRKTIIGMHGRFISGKYDQLRRSVPYSAIIQAFQGLILQIYGEGEARLQTWQGKLTAALGMNGKIITDAIPEMVMIIGPQPEIEALGPEESRNRFNRVFNNFVKVFTADGHPLVLLLDDLQWADSASLNLIQAMATDKDMTHFMLIGAYRDNEVPDHHPLRMTLSVLRKEGIEPLIHSLGPLTLNDVIQILIKFLRCDFESAKSLANIIYAKTLGNPFFINQFLKTLYDERYISYNARTGWQWDIKTIGAMQVTDNVVELMAAKIERLPKAPLSLIKVCACMGNRFDVESLAAITNHDMADILSALDEIISHGLIFISGDIYRFQHDRIHEAAYSLIAPETRQDLHYRIARRLFETTPEPQLHAKIFYIADQYNQGLGLVRTEEERYAVSQLNLMAGIKAKDSNAYDTAENYLKTGLTLLGDDTWTDHYELTYALHLECMICMYLNRKFEESEGLFDQINRHVANNIDRAKVCCAMIILYNNIGKLNEAVELGIQCARLFGASLSNNASKLSVLVQLVPFLYRIKRIGIENIPDLPQADDAYNLHLFELYASIGLPAYFTNPNLYAVTVLKALNLNFKSGVNAISAFGLMATATILTTAMEDYRTAFRLSQAALKLQERIGKQSLACKVYLVYGILLQHFVKPMDEGLTILRKGFQKGLDSGDFIYAGHCAVAIGAGRIMKGDKIDDSLEELACFKDFIETVNDPLIRDKYFEARQTLLNFKGLTDGMYSLTSDDCDQEGRLEAIRENGSLMDLFFRLVVLERIHYLHGDYETAYQLGFELDTMLDAPNGAFHLSEHFFYRSLSLLAVYPNKAWAEQKRILRILKKIKKKMRKLSRSCPENFLAKYLMIEAESSAVSGNFQHALAGYRDAGKTAREHGIMHVEALSHERAGQFLIRKGYDYYGHNHMKSARKAYLRWGATAKVKALEKAYPDLADPAARQLKLSDTFTIMGASTRESPAMLLDLSTVAKVSQAISGEIMLDRLLSKIMTMAVQNAGAQRGFFILNHDGQLTIEAALESETDEVTVLQATPLDQCDSLCFNMVKYVQNKVQSVILTNAAQEGIFVNDPYVARNHCKSMLCMPIQHKGKLSGILYMENNLTHNAFTEERLELLHLVISQAAIALENARLFEMATTDGMTKLFVHRYFQQLLDQEIKRSKRYDRELSLIITDIDNFKTFNDTYGHQLGDQVLKSVARVIRENLRSHDMAARYGGEEFALILPETDTNKAARVAEKIRKLVAAMEIPHEDHHLRVTISIGVATFPIHAAEKQALIRSADNALYAAKKEGKNRVNMGTRINPKCLSEQFKLDASLNQ